MVSSIRKQQHNYFTPTNSMKILLLLICVYKYIDDVYGFTTSISSTTTNTFMSRKGTTLFILEELHQHPQHRDVYNALFDDNYDDRIHQYTRNNNSSNNDQEQFKDDTSLSILSHKKGQQRSRKALQSRKREWADRSLTYYMSVTREYKHKQDKKQQRQLSNQHNQLTSYKLKFSTAKRLYFARYKIKSGRPQHAEIIYQQIINELLFEKEQGEQCYNVQLAISTLLLALLQQRLGQVKETRKTFLRFFRTITQLEEKENLQEQHKDTTSSSNNTVDGIHECTCSAKVLQAFALFEMKQGNRKKSYELVKMAVKMDPALAPVLQWKQFRDVEQMAS